MKKFKKFRERVKPIALMLGILAVSLVFVKMAFATPEAGANNYAPEPNGIVLLSIGFMGWIIRFVRGKFLQVKNVFDVVAGTIGLALLSPVIVILAAYIKIVSPGPAFFKQERVGKGGKTFMIYKLRTMNINAEEGTGPVWARKNDPRLIKGGGFMRKMHFDEFPQLINVIKGDMSVVGPRPERPVFVDSLSREIVDYRKRLEVKPGITGLAQVWHKYDESIKDVRKKIKYDILYIRKMCFLVDIRILLRTFTGIVTGIIPKGTL